ncbi:MAG TPA: ATP-binding cassette domain-containing protein [Actinomycetes bacterium]|nr:ATP-binding cassette domain-containing protein [Actinomycetes bacterium]
MTVGGASAVSVRDLVKRYPKRPVNAVDGLTFEVSPGEIFGLLGPNGAGKTTTVGVLTTMVRATSGSASVAGIDVAADPVGARARLAVVPQRSNLDRSLTPRQNLVFHAAYHGVGRAERNAIAALLLEQFGLTAQADIKVDWYSGGMAQRLMIARALMHEPEVLFLDEPTTGLDPQARLFVWDRIRELRERGVTVVLTTHDMDEAADLADRVGIVDHGRLLALDTPEALTRGLTGQSVLDLVVLPSELDQPNALIAALEKVDGVERAEQVATGPELPAMAAGPGGSAGLPAMAPGAPGFPASSSSNGDVTGPDLRIRLYLSADPASLLGPVVAVLTERAASVSDVHIGRASLEDVFIDLTGRALR